MKHGQTSPLNHWLCSVFYTLNVSDTSLQQHITILLWTVVRDLSCADLWIAHTFLSHSFLYLGARVLIINRCFGLIISLIDLCFLFNNHDKYFISEYMIVYGMVSASTKYSSFAVIHRAQ